MAAIIVGKKGFGLRWAFAHPLPVAFAIRAKQGYFFLIERALCS
jgi:hypothetical protein